MSIDIDQCVEEILDLGHCILHDHFPRPALKECRRGFLSLLEEVATRIPAGNRGPKRWGIKRLYPLRGLELGCCGPLRWW